MNSHNHPDLQCCRCRSRCRTHRTLHHHCCCHQMMCPRLRCSHCLYFHPQNDPHRILRRLCLHYPQSDPHLPDLLHQSYSGLLPVLPLPQRPVLQLPLLLQRLLPLPDVLLLPQRRYALPQAVRSLPAAERSGWNTLLCVCDLIVAVCGVGFLGIDLCLKVY